MSTPATPPPSSPTSATTPLAPGFTPLFTEHSRHWRDNRYVYPVISRRSRGLSLGINLNPDKGCNFDCVYCSVDRSVPGDARGVDLAVVERELDRLLELATSGALYADGAFAATPPALRRLNDVALSGDGEPTASPQFGAALTLAGALIDRHAGTGGEDGRAKLVVITNATLLQRPAVAAAIAQLAARPSEVWAKLDAGSEEYYRLVERTKVPLAQVLANLLACGRARPLVIQSLFLRLHGQGPDAAEIAAWLGHLRDLRAGGCRIDRVQVYTVARRPAEDMVGALPAVEVDAIAAQVRALGFTAEAFYGPE
jgi:wyosine [tRNA(Phe)-imidazoG37] synthetase (radical SAM superfamily)